MRMLLLGLVMLAVSVAVTLLVKHDNGYILLGYGDWTVEGSLAFFLLMNLLAFLIFYLLLRFFSHLWQVPKGVRHWREKRLVRRSQQALNQGLIELSEGNWKGAEKDLVRFAEKSENPMLNYLAAARSAQQQGANDRRDHYLQLAHESTPSAEVAVGLTQAELQLANEQYEQALATLKRLRGIAPKHTHVLKLLKELYERLGEWQALYELLPELKKRKVIDDKAQRALEVNIFRSLLNKAAQAEDSREMENLWRGLPIPIRDSEEMITLYANHLLNHKQQDRVELLLRQAINRHWSEHLVELYGRVHASDKAAQLTASEEWLQAQPRDPALLLTLGRLSMRNKLWGKARSYLEASIGIEPSVDAYRELGLLLDHLGESGQSTACYRQGLELAADARAPEMPALPSVKPIPKLAHDEVDGPGKEQEEKQAAQQR